MRCWAEEEEKKIYSQEINFGSPDHGAKVWNSETPESFVEQTRHLCMEEYIFQSAVQHLKSTWFSKMDRNIYILSRAANNYYFIINQIADYSLNQLF